MLQAYVALYQIIHDFILSSCPLEKYPSPLDWRWLDGHPKPFWHGEALVPWPLGGGVALSLSLSLYMCVNIFTMTMNPTACVRVCSIWIVYTVLLFTLWPLTETECKETNIYSIYNINIYILWCVRSRPRNLLQALPPQEPQQIPPTAHRNQLHSSRPERKQGQFQNYQRNSKPLRLCQRPTALHQRRGKRMSNGRNDKKCILTGTPSPLSESTTLSFLQG